MGSVGLEKIIEAILKSPKGKSFYIGDVPKSVLDELAALNPAYTASNVRTTTHAAIQRNVKDGWPFETTATALDELLSHAGALRGMRNKPGGNRAVSEALWLPGDPVSLFAPTAPLVNGGIEIRTLHEDGFKELMKLFESQAALRGNGALPISSLHRNVSYGGTGSQLPRLSAVKGQPDFGLSLADIMEQVKKGKRSLLPWGLAGGAGAGMLAGAPQNAAAGMDVWQALERQGIVTPDMPLQAPLFDPVNNVVAALTGPAGIAGKMLAGAAETPLSVGLDKIFGGELWPVFRPGQKNGVGAW